MMLAPPSYWWIDQAGKALAGIFVRFVQHINNKIEITRTTSREQISFSNTQKEHLQRLCWYEASLSYSKNPYHRLYSWLTAG